MIFKSGKANAGCWSFGPVLGLCAGYGNKKGWLALWQQEEGEVKLPFFLLGRYKLWIKKKNYL